MTGRGSFRTRAKWSPEEGARGFLKVVVITEIPGWCRSPGWSKKIAELLNEKKLPLVGDSQGPDPPKNIRLVIEPKSRAVDPGADGVAVPAAWAESRIPLDLNVLVKGRIPKVLGLADACANGSTICATCCSAVPTIARSRSSIG